MRARWGARGGDREVAEGFRDPRSDPHTDASRFAVCKAAPRRPSVRILSVPSNQRGIILSSSQYGLATHIEEITIFLLFRLLQFLHRATHTEETTFSRFTVSMGVRLLRRWRKTFPPLLQIARRAKLQETPANSRKLQEASAQPLGKKLSPQRVKGGENRAAAWGGLEQLGAAWSGLERLGQLSCS